MLSVHSNEAAQKRHRATMPGYSDLFWFDHRLVNHVTDFLDQSDITAAARVVVMKEVGRIVSVMREVFNDMPRTLSQNALLACIYLRRFCAVHGKLTHSKVLLCFFAISLELAFKMETDDFPNPLHIFADELGLSLKTLMDSERVLLDALDYNMLVPRAQFDELAAILQLEPEVWQPE